MKTLVAAFALFSFVPSTCLATIWTLDQETIGANFFRDFYFQAIKDPTHGRVNYVDEATALQEGLAGVSQDGLQFIMRADSSRVVQPTERGRDSVRIASKRVYDNVREGSPSMT